MLRFVLNLGDQVCILHLQLVSAQAIATFQMLPGHLWPVVPVLDSAGLSIAASCSYKEAMPLAENKNKSPEAIILCLKAPASAVGTFAFISSLTLLTVPIIAIEVIYTHKAQMGLFAFGPEY